MANLGNYGLGRRERAALARRGARVSYVIGDSDTGKTTLAACVAKLLAAKHPTALVDLDAGQASVGLPTTFAWKMCGPRGPGRGKPDGMFFAGTTSPVGYFPVAVAGAAALVAEARGRADRIVIDTCGLARGPMGMELHHTTVEALRPDVVVAIERAGELSELLAPFIRSGWPQVIRASVPDRVTTRSSARRRAYRCARFRDYFERAREIVLELDEVGILRPRRDPAGRIASLRDAGGRDLALAIVQKVDRRRGTISVLSPVPKRATIRAVVLGSMRIARDGRQLARNV